MKLLFLYTLDWNHEVEAFEDGLVPSHRLFGFPEVKEMGHHPLMCPSPTIFRRSLRKPVGWRLYQTLYTALIQRSVDCIFAVNEASALPVLVLKRLGLLKTPVIVFCTGLMHPRNRSGARKRMWSWLLPCAEAVVSQTTMELETTWKEFGLREDRQFLIPMLVDPNYFQPDDILERENYCLAAGTNDGRDYPTLLKAFPKEEKLIVVTDPVNAEIVKQHTEPGMQVQVLQGVAIRELRRLYQGAKIVINPLVETPYCSGHTVLLENMALGKPVIISKVAGMRDYIEDGVTVIGYEPRNVEDLRRKIRAYLDQPEQFKFIGKQAREWVQRFSCEEFAKKVVHTAEAVLAADRELMEECAAR